MNKDIDIEEEGGPSLLEPNKDNGAPANYITKSVNVELAAGRYIRFISPEGEETIVLKGRSDRFRKQNKVDSRWTVL
jgi:hypothetical protein